MDSNNNLELKYRDQVEQHYITQWGQNYNTYLWDKGPFYKVSPFFRVLQFLPNETHNMWTYATVCMSSHLEKKPIELHLFSNKQDNNLIELLTIVAYYHQNTHKIGLNDTVNFGKSWQDDSFCHYGYISLPYLDGPSLENLYLNEKQVKFYWLIPITPKELYYKMKYGVEKLEEMFEEKNLDYMDPNRSSTT